MRDVCGGGVADGTGDAELYAKGDGIFGGDTGAAEKRTALYCFSSGVPGGGGSGAGSEAKKFGRDKCVESRKRSLIDGKNKNIPCFVFASKSFVDGGINSRS